MPHSFFEEMVGREVGEKKSGYGIQEAIKSSSTIIFVILQNIIDFCETS